MQPKILCSKCHNQIEWEDKYCSHCGEPVELPRQVKSPASSSGSKDQSIVCRSCGESNPSDATFCRACGAPIGEKRSDKPIPVQSTSEKKKIQSQAPSWKIIAGLVLFLVGGVVVLELFTGKKDLPKVEEHQHDMPAANMEALPQIEELEKKVAANPNDTSVLLQLANSLHDNRFYDKAIAYYTRYLEMKPKDADARVDLGICYNDSGNKDEGVRQLKVAIKDNPKHVLAHFNLGIVHLQAQELREANEWFKKTISLAPTSEAAGRARRLLEQHSASSEPVTN